MYFVGSADCVENAKKRILEIVEELENFIEDSCVISQKHHRAVLGKQGNELMVKALEKVS